MRGAVSIFLITSTLLGLALGSITRVYSLVPAVIFICGWVALRSRNHNFLGNCELAFGAIALCQVSFFVGAVMRSVIARRVTRRPPREEKR